MVWGWGFWGFYKLLKYIEPATEKQKRLLKDLGVKYEGYLTKNKASELISKELKRRKKPQPATEKQKKLLRDLGIEFDRSITKKRASELISSGLKKRRK